MARENMKIHFIGIGGIGVSALAQYYLAKGHEISGSDLVSSEITDLLKKKGAKIHIGEHRASQKLHDLVIYSPAVKENNPELESFKKRGLKCQSYPEALGKLTKKYFTIAVCGTHGKSTTTALISLILIKAGFDPTVILGTKLKELGDSNSRVGESKYLVIEADEWQASFLNYFPKIIVLTFIEREHLDYYKNLNHILKTYKEFIGHLPKNGVLVANGDDNNILRILNSKFKTKLYSLCQKDSKKLRKILKIPGEHNLSNALAALTTARILKIPDKTSFETLSEYQGAWRRFEIKKCQIANKKSKITIISDYAHHPTEIRVTLKAAREKFPKKKIWCIFQPHQYQRTYYLFDDFVKVFKKVPIDKLIITDIYDVAGRENKKIKKEVNSKKIIEAINKKSAIFLPKDKILKYLKKNLRGREVLIIMGAGDIYKLEEKLTFQRLDINLP